MISKGKKKILLGIIVLLKIGLDINAALMLFFMSHLQFGTNINGIDVGGWKCKDVKAMLEEKAQDYKLVLKERGGEEESISGGQIGFSYDIGEQITKIKKEQYPAWWIGGLWHNRDYKVDLDANYDEQKLDETVDQLECLSKERSIAPENAGIELVQGNYKIIEGKEGSLIKKNELKQQVKKAIDGEEKTLDLDKLDCYEEAKIKTDDPSLKAQCKALNQYVSSVITYDFGDRQEVLDGDKINQWINIDGDYKVSLDEAAVAAYVDELASTYDTMYGTRSFKTSVQKTVTVTGGDYGWKIDRQEETKALIDLIKKGNQKVTRKPVYEYEGWCRDKNDIGNTYVEVNLTRQYLWFYKDGQLVTEGSIVSGTGSNSHATPEGTYRIDYKKANAILRGPGYACPVSYWMPFNCGIGIHDAVWRSSFGGTIYMYSGSHGCINAPLTMAKAIFEQIQADMPVVCYKEH